MHLGHFVNDHVCFHPAQHRLKTRPSASSCSCASSRGAASPRWTPHTVPSSSTRYTCCRPSTSPHSSATTW